MKKNLLFYQANFEPEVNRAIDAFSVGNQKHFEFFKNKTLKIVDEILNFSTSFVEKEEWYVVRNLTENIPHILDEEREILRNYGNPFSMKFARLISLES